MSKNKIQFVYCLCNKIIDTWIEDFIDEDTGDIVIITRHSYDSIQYLGMFELPISKSKLDKNDIEDLVRLEVKINYKNIRLDSIISKRKYTSIKNTIDNKSINNKHYRLL